MIRNGMEKEGKLQLELARQYNPRDPKIYEGLAKYYDAIGDLTAAKEYKEMAKALTAKPGTAPPRPPR